MTQSTSAVSGGRRKRTDLIPTMPIHRHADGGDRSPRSPLYGSSSGASSSRGSVSRSTGMSMSLSRLDQLSQPRRRNHHQLLSSPNPQSAHSALQPLHETDTLTTTTTAPKTGTARSSRPTRPSQATTSSTKARSMSKSMSHLASATKTAKTEPSAAVQSAALVDGQPRTTRAERLRLRARQASQRPHGGFSLSTKKKKTTAALLNRLFHRLSVRRVPSSLFSTCVFGGRFFLSEFSTFTRFGF